MTESQWSLSILSTMSILTRIWLVERVAFGSNENKGLLDAADLSHSFGDQKASLKRDQILVPFQTCLLSCSCSSHQMYWDCSSVEVGSNANKDCYSANVSHLARSCWLNVQGLHMPHNPSWICRCFKTVHCQAQFFMWPCLTDWQKGNLCVRGPCWFLILTHR